MRRLRRIVCQTRRNAVFRWSLLFVVCASIGALVIVARSPASAGVVRASTTPRCSLRAGGIDVVRLPRGRYRIFVRDASVRDSFWLRGPAVDKQTRPSFAGTIEWRVRFTRGSYRFGCRSGAGTPFRVS